MAHTATNTNKNRRRGLIAGLAAGFLVLGTLSAVAGADETLDFSFLGMGSASGSQDASVDESGELYAEGSLEAAYQMQSRARMILDETERLETEAKGLVSAIKQTKGSLTGQMEASASAIDYQTFDLQQEAVKNVNIADRVVLNLEQYTSGDGYVDVRADEVFTLVAELDGQLSAIEDQLAELEGEIKGLLYGAVDTAEGVQGTFQASYNAHVTTVMDAKERIEALVESSQVWKATLEAALEAFVDSTTGVGGEASGAVNGEVKHAAENAGKTSGDAGAAFSHTGSLTSTLAGWFKI